MTSAFLFFEDGVAESWSAFPLISLFEFYPPSSPFLFFFFCPGFLILLVGFALVGTVPVHVGLTSSWETTSLIAEAAYEEN
jgi:hypothetical protein